MKRLFTFFYVMLCCAAATMAADGVAVGYCNGQVTRTSSVSVDGETWVSAAIRLTADMLAPYAGSDISAVRVGLAARTNLDEVRVWLRTSLSGDDLATGAITTESTPAIVRGWNDVELATPYTIKSGETLYVGLSYRQRAASNALSVVAGQADGAFYFKGGEEAEWEDRSADGLLSLEAVVTGDNLALYDLELLSAEARYNGVGDVEVTALVHNNASQAVGGFTLTATVEDSGEAIATHFEQTLGGGASATLRFTLAPQTEGAGREHHIVLSISAIDGDVADEQPDNNALRLVFTYQRRVLVEEFTGEDCTNCPRAALFLHQALYQDGYLPSTVMMAHHAGYTPDWLTFDPSDTEYEWFFNSDEIVYAPALMLDRVAQENSWGTMTPCIDPESRDFIGTAIAYMLQRTSRAYIDLTAQLSGDQLSVGVTGGRTTVFGLTPTRLTICLVEDHVQQRAQVSMNQYPEFEHMGVLRAINTTWGEPVDWQADRFAVEQTFTLSPDWQTDNLRVVAFIHDYDAADPTRCEVENATDLSVATLTEGIVEVQPAQGSHQRCYDLLGRQAVGAGPRIVVDAATHKKYIR